jgi:hypothetical protein
MLEGFRVLRRDHPIPLTDDPCRIADIGHDAWHATGHGLTDDIGKPFSIRAADAHVKGIVDIRHVLSCLDPQQTFPEAQSFGERLKGRPIISGAVPYADKPSILVMLHK